jgi:hypothetical protein
MENQPRARGDHEQHRGGDVFKWIAIKTHDDGLTKFLKIILDF